MIEFLWTTTIIACSSGAYLELFARHKRPNWHQWGNEIGTGPKSAIKDNCLNEIKIELINHDRILRLKSARQKLVSVF